MAATSSGPAGATAGDVDFTALFRAMPTPYLVMTPDLVIAECNDAYLATVGRTRDELLGRPVFAAFPPQPDALDETGVSRVQRSFERARDTGQPDTMPIQKYDIPDPVHGGFTERFWSLISIPVPGPDGATRYVLQRAEDITDVVREQDRGRAAVERGDAFERRVAEVEADLLARAQELAAAVAAQEVASRRLAGLAEVALQLAGTRDVAELVDVVVGAGLRALGADGGAVAVLDAAAGELHLTITDSLGPEAQREYAVLPLDGPLPPSHVVRTGDTVLLPDRAAGLAWSEATARVYAATGKQAWAVLPLTTGGRRLGCLVASWQEPRAFPPDEVDLLAAFAAQCAQALHRLQVRELEQRAAEASRRLSEQLQRSLLTDPPQPPGLQVQVRYQPAAREAQIGGDWYDAFVVPDGGNTTLVIGDVTGHDRAAATVMAQVRNVLRGVAQIVAQPPAPVLAALERALRHLAVDVLATAVLAQVSPDDAAGPGGHAMVWCSAGHPPPLLLHPDGRAELLEREPDLLLGLGPATTRRDHRVLLPAGATVLLYTDGLVERRGESLDEGLARLVRVATELAALDVPGLCDALLARLGEDREDDVALLVLQVLPDA